MKFLAWHLGLGDALAFADLAVKLADGDQLFVPCWPHNEISVKSIFVNHPNMGVMAVRSEGVMQNPFTGGGPHHGIRLGHYSGIPRNEGEDMIEWVYRTAGLLPDDRFDDGVVAKAARLVPQRMACAGCAFVHDDPSRGFIIQPEAVSVPVSRRIGMESEIGSILAYTNAIAAAKEIHCIDSAFLHLVENMSVSAQTKLVYHKYARPGSEAYRTLRHNWTVIE